MEDFEAIRKINYTLPNILLGHVLAQLVEALRYKPEGRGFESRCCPLA